MLVTYQYTETITAYLNTVRDISHTMYQAALPWKLQAKRPSSLHVERRVKKNQQKNQTWNKKRRADNQLQCGNRPEKIKKS